MTQQVKVANYVKHLDQGKKLKVIEGNYNYKIVVHNDFLPHLRRGSHVKSDNTHAIINTHPLAIYLTSAP